MNAELQMIAQRLQQAASPEEIFGEILGDTNEKLVSLKATYRQLAKSTHPDLFPDSEDRRMAEGAFGRLTEWFTSAEQKLKAGVYGLYAGEHSIILQTRQRAYVLDGNYTETLVYNRYPCAFQRNARARKGFLKITRNPEDNELASNETRILEILRNGKASRRFGPYLPRLVDSFLYEQGGVDYQVNVFERGERWYSLEAVRQAYPHGIDPKDMAWMFRRVLVALGFLHLNGVIHGAVLPGHIAILPEEHGLTLEEYSFAIHASEDEEAHIKVIDPAHEDWYPLEIRRRESPLPGADIGMAAQCMMYVLGASPHGSDWPDSVPDFLRSFLKGCTLPGKRARPQNAWALKEEFDQLLEKHWGERKFHPFTMNP